MEVGLKINLNKMQLMKNLVLNRNVSVAAKDIEQNASYKHSRTIFGCVEINYVFKSDLLMRLKRKIFDQCVLTVLTYGAETVTLKKVVNKIHVTQRAIERRMLYACLKNRILNE